MKIQCAIIILRKANVKIEEVKNLIDELILEARK